MPSLFSGESIDSGAALKRCRLLFLLTILLLVLQHVVDGLVGGIIIGVSFITVIGQGAIALSDDPRHRRAGFVMGVLAAIGMAVNVVWSDLPRGALALISGVFLVFSGYVTWRLLFFVVFGQADNRTKLSAALSAYLLAGLTFAMAYVAIQLLDPAAFRGAPIDEMTAAAKLNTDDAASFRVFSYFSFVTLTTLGYGEIVPVSPYARILVMLEAIGGVLYVAVMVASLVGRVRWEGPGGPSEPEDQPPS